MNRSLAQPQALAHRPLWQPLTQPQSQHLTYLPHRQSLTRHLVPLLLGKGSKLPAVEDCQRPTGMPPPPDAIMITGTDDHDPPETMITINWIE